MKNIYEMLGVILSCIFILSINGINFAALFIVSTIFIIYICVISNRISKKIDNKFMTIISNIMKLLVILFITSFILIEGIIISDIISSKDMNNIDKLDYILVLGAGLDGEKVGKTLQSRLDKALEYYNINNDAIFIVSGGQGKDEIISEAEAMYRYLVENGVEKDKILKEDKATTTLENIKFTKEILRDRNDENKKILIVTNDFHLFRAKTIANILDVENDGLASNTPIKVRVNYLIREYPTMIIDIIRTSIEAK